MGKKRRRLARRAARHATGKPAAAARRKPTLGEMFPDVAAEFAFRSVFRWLGRLFDH